MNIILYGVTLLLVTWTLQVSAAPSVSVALVMDESGSISSSNFQLETNGFIEAVKRIPTDSSVEASIIAFASSTQVIRNKVLLDAAGSSDLQNALATNTQSGGGTNMSGAINTATSVLTGSAAPTRIICLATDGQPDSQSATIAAADAARSAGVILAPIGIGLSATRKAFLDAIADPTHSPVPNPATFDEFATVVRNACIGIVESALRLRLTPDRVDFGIVEPDDADSCGSQKSVDLENLSNTSAQVQEVFVRGVPGATDESSAFQLNRVGGQPAPVAFPVPLPPLTALTIDLEVSPALTAQDGVYDAELVVRGLDSSRSPAQTVEITARLVAPVASDAGCLAVRVIDAQAVVHRIANGRLFKSDNTTEVDEPDVLRALVEDDARPSQQRILDRGAERKGVVTDGNARVLLVSTLSQTGGTVKFEILQPESTEATLHPLWESPDGGRQTVIEVPIKQQVDGKGQATAVLRAGERFLGGANEPAVGFDVRVCLLDAQGGCTGTSVVQRLLEMRAPVVLIHGIWGGENSWTETSKVLTVSGNSGQSDVYLDRGVRPALENAHFLVDVFTYNSNQGPTQVMRPENTSLADRIKNAESIGEAPIEGLSGTGVCNQITWNKELACTRADIVAHSMGGLVTRKFIYENLSRSRGNFFQGAIRRFITIGTPHSGSRLANFLLSDNQEINNCIIDMLPIDGAQNMSVDQLVAALNLTGKSTREGGVSDLAVGSKLLKDLAPARGSIVEFVPTVALWGNLGPDKVNLTNWLANGFLSVVFPLTGCNGGDLFGGSNTDGIVPEESARFVSAGLTKSEELSGRKHVGMGTDDNVAQRVIQLLNGPASAFEPFAFPVSPQRQAAYDVGTRALKGGAYVQDPDEESAALGMIGALVEKALGLIGIGDARAAESEPAIQLSVNAETAFPGGSFVFTATVVGQADTPIVLSDGDTFVLEDDAAPYEWVVPIRRDAAGRLSVRASAVVDGKFVASEELPVTVLPDTSQLSQLVFSPGRPLLMSVGETRQLAVVGRFLDGYDRPLWESVTGTVYSENLVDGNTVIAGDSPVVNVSPEGVVMAIQSGSADVVAENNGIRAVRRVEVFNTMSLIDQPKDTDKRICSVLGNDPKPSLLDQDIFEFQGKAGDAITIRLEKDTSGTTSGDRASLILMQKGKLSVLKLDRSDLPNQLDLALPKMATYQVVVGEEPMILRGKRFKGNYCVILSGPQGALDTFKPTARVE